MGDQALDSTMTNWEEMQDPKQGQQDPRPPKEVIPMTGPGPDPRQPGGGKSSGGVNVKRPKGRKGRRG
jgi:hypothetical protein